MSVLTFAAFFVVFFHLRLWNVMLVPSFFLMQGKVKACEMYVKLNIINHDTLSRRDDDNRKIKLFKWNDQVYFSNHLKMFEITGCKLLLLFWVQVVYHWKLNAFSKI